MLLAGDLGLAADALCWEITRVTPVGLYGQPSNILALRPAPTVLALAIAAPTGSPVARSKKFMLSSRGAWTFTLSAGPGNGFSIECTWPGGKTRRSATSNSRRRVAPFDPSDAT
jgi:hypothetical protein